MERFLLPHEGMIKKEDRQRLNGHKSAILWFTGLPSSGKSTLAQGLDEKLFIRGIRAFVMDGDDIRTGLNRDLGFTAEDRQENIRRIGEVARLFVEAGLIAITAFISPYRRDREFVRSRVRPDEFIEIYVKCPLGVCEQRDVKGYYKKARQEIIKNFTGVDAPYEEPENPEIVVETEKMSVDQSVDAIMHFLVERGYMV